MLQIDGRIGGGGVVRIAVGLSAATNTPVTITDIRANRPQPGLKQQHLAGVQATADLCNADVTGLNEGSSRLVFRPEDTTADQVSVSIPTAGAVGLVLQPLQIAATAVDHPVTVSISGGATAGKWAPPVETVRNVVCPLLGRFGVRTEITIDRHGFYPVGGAAVTAVFQPSALTRADLSVRGGLKAVRGVSLAAEQLEQRKVAERQRDAAVAVLGDAEIETRSVAADSSGSCITLWAEYENGIMAGDAVGERGVPAERVGEQAAETLLAEQETGAGVDAATADQLVPVLGLAGGRIRIPRVTDHLTAAVAVTNRFTDEVWIDEDALLMVS